MKVVIREFSIFRTIHLNRANKKPNNVTAKPKNIPNIKDIDEEAQRMLVKPKSINVTNKLGDDSRYRNSGQTLFFSRP